MATQVKANVEKRTFSAAEVAEYLGISLVGAYNLMHSQEFPAFFIGKRILVTCEAFEKWLQEQQRKIV